MEEIPGQTEAWRLRRGGAAPRVVAKLDDLDEQPTPEQISADDTFRKARNRQQGPSFPGSARPISGLHAAHARTQDEAQPLQSDPFRHEEMLRFDDVGVAVSREGGLQSVTRLAGAAVSDGVWQDNEILADIQRLACSEQEISGGWLQELRAGAGRPCSIRTALLRSGAKTPSVR